MDGQLSLSVSHFLVPLLLAFIAGMIGRAWLLGGTSRSNGEPAVVLEKREGGGAGWAVALLLALLSSLVLLVGR